MSAFSVFDVLLSGLLSNMNLSSIPCSAICYIIVTEYFIFFIITQTSIYLHSASPLPHYPWPFLMLSLSVCVYVPYIFLHFIEDNL